MAKHTPYYELRDALAEPGCPICRLVIQAVHRFLSSLTYDAANDPGVQAEVRRARGFCNVHAWQLAGMTGGAFDVAILHRAALQTLLEAAGEAERILAGPAGSLDRLRQALGLGEEASARASVEVLVPQTACPVCALRAQTERSYAGVLLAHIDESELAEALVVAGGLCWPHMRMVLGQSAQRTCHERLLELQRVAAEGLLEELETFIRKHDYRLQDEPMMSEGDAWLRVVAHVSGLRGLG